MNHNIKDYEKKYEKKHRNHRIRFLIVFMLAVCTSITVGLSLKQTGISMTADYQCGKEEHVHTDDCYTTTLICENTDETHVHDENCYQTTLTCDKEEHTHSTACYSDTTADVETANDWEQYRSDSIVTVATSQIGYHESTANFSLIEDVQKGYTRYGEYYGTPYSDWDSTFVAFCLNYSNHTDYPTNIGSNALYIQLDNNGLYHTKDTYTPNSGDLVFFDNNYDSAIDHVGIITSINEDNTITVIEGDVNDEVEQNVYSRDDSRVVGYSTVDQQTTVEEQPTEEETVIEEAPTEEETLVEEQSVEETVEAIETDSYTYTDAVEEVAVETYSEDDGIMLVDDSSTGVDMNGYITSVSFQKKDGKIWKESTSFTTDDQVKGTISFANIETSTIKANGNKIYIDLPEYINCKDFVGKTYNAYDGGTQSGTYTFEKDSDGNYRIVLTLLDSYVNSAGNTIGGSLEFQFEWDEDKVPSSGLDKVEIGNWDGEIEIKNTKSTEEEKTENKYNLSKKASDLRYSEDGKTVYIDYTLTLKVKSDVTAPITMKDVLTATGFAYGDTVSITGDGVKVNFDSKQDASTNIQVWATSGDTIKAGEYTITYTVKSTVDVSAKSVTISDSVKNEITLKDEKGTHKKDTTTSTTTGTINKQGKLVSGSDATYIDYTVYLNAGDIVKNLTEGANFTDTLPSELELQGDVTVKQYDVTGKLVSTNTATVDGQNISYTTPTGQYYYEITYRTKVKGSEIPIGGTTVKNDGKSTGGIDGSSSSTITIPNDVLDKSYVSKTNPEKDSDGKWVIKTIKWTSKIDIEGSLEGYVYEDWGELKSTQTGVWFAPLFMTDDQYNAIVVKDASGNVVDPSRYTLEKSTHSENKWTGSANEDIVNGLFKITFSADVTGPVIIEYETAADMTNFVVNDNFALVNWGSVSKDGHTDTDSAQTTTINYQHGNRNIVRKYANGESSSTSGSSSMTLEPGQTTIPWTISVNEGRSITSDVTVTDTIADGMTLDVSTVKIVINGWNDVTNNTTYCTWSFDKSTQKLTVNVKYDAFKADASTGIASYPFTVSYSTKLPDSFFSGSETTKEFSNTASVEVDGSTSDSTFTEKVTRQVVGKNGSYDETTKTLSYNVIINPDGSTLNKDNALKVEDTLKLKDSSSDTSNFMQYVHLKSLKLFTALKRTDASGNVSVLPGTYIQDLTKVDSGIENFTYTYSEDTDSKGVTSDTFTTYLPDSTAYVIVAEYGIDVDVSEDIAFTNRVKLTGSDSWEKKDESTKATSSTSGTTYTNKDILTISKHDKSSYTTMLSGAVFSLDKYENSAWSNVASLTTGENGKVTQTDIAYNTLYKLTETTAPSGYVIDTTPSYFIVVREADASSAKDNLPDSIDGDTSYSKDAVKVYTVKDNTDTQTYYANIEIDRYNAQDTSKTEPGQLRVNKVWIDGSGNQVTDTSTLLKKPEVTVTLKKHSPAVANVTFSGTNSSSVTTTMKIGTRFSSSWNMTYEVSSGSATISDDKKTVTVNGDVVLTASGYVNNEFLNSLTKDESQASTGTTDTVIGSVTLNSSNDWTYLWSNLERGDGITYSISEATVDGYKTTYKINSTDLEAGSTFSLGENGDIVTISNAEERQYELPSTGGSGIQPYVFTGSMLILSAIILCLYKNKRRNERRNT